MAIVNTAPTNQTQQNFQESAYEDATWEIVGEKIDNSNFEPAPFQVVGRASVTTDPMFADFGGLASTRDTERWHLPKHLSHRRANAREAEAAPDRSIKMLPEELEKLTQEAYQKGLREGSAAGESRQQEQLKAMQQGLQTVMQDIGAQLTENLVQMEKATVKLAVSIGEKIIGQAVEINPEYIGSLVREALSSCGTAEIKRIRVSPQDMEFITIVGLQGQGVVPEGWSFEKDDTIRAGCVVETSAGEVDFRIDSAWERMKENILRVIR